MEFDALHTGAAMLLRRRCRKAALLRTMYAEALLDGTDPVLLTDLRTRLSEAEQQELDSEIQLEEIENEDV